MRPILGGHLLSLVLMETYPQLKCYVPGRNTQARRSDPPNTSHHQKQRCQGRPLQNSHQNILNITEEIQERKKKKLENLTHPPAKRRTEPSCLYILLIPANRCHKKPMKPPKTITTEPTKTQEIQRTHHRIKSQYSSKSWKELQNWNPSNNIKRVSLPRGTP